MVEKIKLLIWPLFLVTISLLVLKLLLTKRLTYTDDGKLHAARIANYYLAIKQGQLPPRWAPNLDSGYGSPVLNFTYPLPYMLGALIYMALPTTLVLALNLSLILLILTGALGTYFLAKKFALAGWQSLLAALLYTSAPYTLINIFSRTALGEISFFAFLPWLMWSLEHLFKNHKIKW